MKYKQIYDNEWVQPRRKNYLMKCCDCGLAHSVDFKLVKDGRGSFIFMKARRLKKKLST